MSSTPANTTTGSAPTPPSRLLTLPAEIRLDIYSHLTIQRRYIEIPTNTLFPSLNHYIITLIQESLPVAILSVCRLIHAEATPVLRPKLQQLASTPPKIIVKVNSSYTYDTRRSIDDGKMVEYIFTAFAGSLYRGGWGSGRYRDPEVNVGAHIHRPAHSESSLTSSRDWIVEAVSLFAHRAATQLLHLRSTSSSIENGIPGMEVLFQVEKCKYLSRSTFGHRVQGVLAWVNDKWVPVRVRLDEGNLEECGWEGEQGREKLKRAVWKRCSSGYGGLVGVEEWEEMWKETM
jgi:hypothetical protein